MAKLFRILGISAGALLLLVLAGVIVLWLAVDPNAFKDPITTRVKQATGRDLHIAGDLGLSVFPRLELELNALELGNAPGFGSEPFATVEHARLQAELIPLLRRQLVVGEVRIQGVNVHLLRNEAGANNWQDLAQPPPGRAAPDAQTREQAAPNGARALASFFVSGIELVDGQLRWEDRRAGQRLHVRHLELSTGAITPGRPVALQLTFAIHHQAPAVTARIEMTGSWALDESGETLRAEPLEIQLSDLKTDRGLSAAAALQTSLHLDLGNATGSLDPFHLRIENLETADGRAGELGLDARLAVDLGARQYRFESMELRLNGRDPRLPGTELAATGTAGVHIDLAEQTLDVEDLRVRAGDLRISGEARGSQVLDTPRYRGQLVVAELDLRRWMEQQGLQAPATADSATLQRFSLSTPWQLADGQVSLDGLRLRLDDTQVKGALRLVSLTRPGFRFDLQLDRLDVDRYLLPRSIAASEHRPPTQPAAPSDGATRPPQPAEESPPTPAPLAWLRTLDLEGQLAVGELKLGGLKGGRAQLEIQAKGGQINLDHHVKRFYGGTLDGDLGLDARGPEPRWRLVERARRIQADPFLRDLTGKSRLTGTGGFGADLRAAGRTRPALTRSLEGQLDFRFSNGTFKGFNLARAIREAKARLQGETLPPSNQPLQTDFSELSASAQVANGVARNEDLAAKSPYLRVSGRGSVDIAAATLDYRLEPIIVKSPSGQGDTDLSALEGIPIPVHLRGPWRKPHWEIDIASVVEEVGKEKLIEKIEQDERVRRQLDKLEERTGIKGLGEGLKGLFGR